MQLLIIALIALLAGGGGNKLSELQPLIKSLGGENAENILKQTEEISSMLTAVQSLTAARPKGGEGSKQEAPAHADLSGTGGFPLAPISRIADDRITYALSGYVATGE